MRTLPSMPLLVLAALAAADPDRAAVRAAWPQGGGLAVQVGVGDGALLAALADEGRLLVHGLALDDAARDAARAGIAAQGRAGLASVATWHERGRLPYAANLVNLLIADLDALGAAAPPRSELERVVAPFGVLLLRQGGAWSRTAKPRPAAMDDWGHFDHGADGNPLSRDELAGPVRQQQWLSDVMPNPWEGNPAGYDPGGGLRVWGRYCLCDVNDAHGATGKGEHWELHCRDAFNGILLWSLPRPSQVARRRWSLVAADGLAFTWLKTGGDLVALDLATGKEVRAFAGTAPPGKGGGLSDEQVAVRVEGGALVVALGERLLCFDVASGAQRWAFSRAGKLVLAPSLSARHGRVFAVVAAPRDRPVFTSRWPAAATAEAVIALDLATGTPVWECAEASSRVLPAAGKEALVRGIGQVVPATQHLVLFGSAAIGGGSSPFVGSIDLASGKLLHADDEPFKRNYNVAAYNLLVRDEVAWFAGAFTNVWRYDPAAGKVERALSDGWNQRCTRLTATPKWLLFGQTAFYGPDLAGEQDCVARSGCALGDIPANGMLYFMPNACGCITQVRGFHALTGEAAPPPLPDERRLVAGGAPPPPAAVAAPTGLVAGEWGKQWRVAQAETAAVAAGDLRLVALCHLHRVEARRGAAVAWAFTADARVSAPPAVAGDSVLFGAHDGWVYCLALADGHLRWKHLLAPSHRLIAINGQLESAWPVYGVAVDGGAVVASAGGHVELGGGVRVARLDVASGRPAWTRTLRKAPSVVPPGGKGARIVGHSFINSVPRLDGGAIVLGDGGRRGGEFRFTPDESEEALAARLSTPAAKKK